jgi:thiamine-phosphate diphosphorylase
MSKPPFDLSLYLVTDSSLLPPGRTLVSHVEEAIRGGVTIVQLREKTLATAKFIELGLELHKVTREYNVPLLINDRVDVALAVGCEGVHIGWDDCCGYAST